MKKKLVFLLAGITAILFISACSNDEDDNDMDAVQTVSDIQTNIVSGDWMISSYVDSGVDETSDYAGYTFTFNNDGVVSASSTAEMLTGAWSVEMDSSMDDSSDSNVDFTLFFGVPDTHDFDELSDDWDVVSYTSTMLSLRDVSGGSGEVDTLVFTRK
ncbi:MAG: hypothetical protein KJO04_06700 [Bacteroidia bacterium]|nr:hypothetical protein [Bacteroidia bacterium]